MKIGYSLSSEEFGSRELVRQARRAEEAGFERLWIFDHFHPWNDDQLNPPSAFVWSTIGAISQATSRTKLKRYASEILPRFNDTHSKHSALASGGARS